MRARRDLDDNLDDSLFDRDEVEHRPRRRTEEVERLHAQAKEIDARDAAFRASALASVKDGRRRDLLAEYRAAGVEPQGLDGDGTPTVSLALLLRLNWTIEEVNRGEWKLVAPGKTG